MKNHQTLFPELQLINNSVFKLCGFELGNINPETESQEYFACNFQLNGFNIQFRKAKVTPKKVGQFVTLWKRSETGITEPFNILDDFDFYIIATQVENQLGIFIFPKAVLLQNKILSDKNKDGKRGFRVYPPWDIVTNNQAQKTQLWQKNYFINISPNKEIDLESVKKILKK